MTESLPIPGLHDYARYAFKTRYALQGDLESCSVIRSRLERTRSAPPRRGPCLLHDLVAGAVGDSGDCHRRVDFRPFHSPGASYSPRSRASSAARDRRL